MATFLTHQTSYGYQRLDKWDPQERAHREAQFLIYKTLQKADQVARLSKSSWLGRFRFRKLRVKVGRRLLRLRRGVVLGLAKARARLSKRVSGRLAGLWASGPAASSPFTGF